MRLNLWYGIAGSHPSVLQGSSIWWYQTLGGHHQPYLNKNQRQGYITVCNTAPLGAHQVCSSKVSQKVSSLDSLKLPFQAALDSTLLRDC
jgi:hypothetical protein